MTRAVFGLALVLFVASPAFRADEEYRKQREKEVARARVMIPRFAGLSATDQANEAPCVATKYDIGHVMHAAFKPRDKGGIGIGAKPDTVLPDSIELKIITLAKRTPAPAELAQEAAEIARMAAITRAVAELTRHWGPKQKNDPHDLKLWALYTDDMKRGADQLRQAARSREPDAVNEAATFLYDACINCHRLGVDDR
jgi:hypothetical protein